MNFSFSKHTHGSEKMSTLGEIFADCLLVLDVVYYFLIFFKCILSAEDPCF